MDKSFFLVSPVYGEFDIIGENGTEYFVSARGPSGEFIEFVSKALVPSRSWKKIDNTPSTEQVGGTHYHDMDIQPWEVISRAGLDFWEGNVIKYVMRYKAKNGLEDLKKARHYLDYLIERESDE